MPEQIVVPVGAGDEARRALAVAHTMARQLDAEVVAQVTSGSERAAGRLEPWGLAASVGVELAAVETVSASDTLDALIDVTQDPKRLACLALPGRGRSRAALGGKSVQRLLANAVSGIVLVGPHVPDAPIEAYRHVVAGCAADGHLLSGLDELRMLASAGLVPWLVEVLRPDGGRATLDVPAAALAYRAARALGGAACANWEVLYDRSVSRALARFASDLGDCLVVVGDGGRSTRHAAGPHPDVALAVARHATGPVLVVPSTLPVSDPRVAGSDSRVDVRLDLDRVKRVALA